MEKTSYTHPEWLLQRIAVEQRKAKWEDYSFEERTCSGWLRPYLFAIDAMYSGRWNYWTNILDKGEIGDAPIPGIDFESTGSQDAYNNLNLCLSKFVHHGIGLSHFLDWLLWGFGEGEERPNISSEVNEYWYRTFNMGYLIRDPYDYLGELLSQTKTGYWNNPNAFFPTPHSVCQAMAKMQFEDAIKQGKDCRTLTVCDPCVGTGRMLLYASNYSLRLFGQDIDRVCLKACHINGYLYAPWLVKPAPFFSEPEEKSDAVEEPVLSECSKSAC